MQNKHEMLSENYREDAHQMQQIVNRIMVIMSLEENVPCAFGNNNDKIKTLLWNKEQLAVLKEKNRRILLTGISYKLIYKYYLFN